ncbi:hypothetical protein [Bacillus wiedmannii]|uniref:hypothetical protein n=1 Tax=Bacillus wiedmannii TaxID=1890302 RepID=UPI000BF11BE5|nr:hypothetical protein [Bacillus wiedmannii]PEM08527.1 hypothetical protein CN610_19945 [Bacillus wiedmannii]
MTTTTELNLDGLRVGDKVKGMRSAPYLFTDHNLTLGEVTRVMEGTGNIDVKVLEFVPGEGLEKGEVYDDLQPKYFELVEPKLVKGDIIAGKPGQEVYGITTQDMLKAEVIEVDGEEFDLRVIEHKSRFYNGDIYRELKPKHFVRLAESPKTEAAEAEGTFKKGDKVTPNDKTIGKYRHTKKGVMTEGVVLSVLSADRMRIKITASSDTTRIGREYNVDQHRFDKLVLKMAVGAIVVPNEKTIGQYSVTRKGRMLEGVVEEVKGSWIRVKVTKMVEGSAWIGQVFAVNPDSFDVVTPAGVAVEKKPENPFKVGQRVTGNEDSNKRYFVTNTRMLEAEVLELIGDDKMKIKVTKHLGAENVGIEFTVETRYFRKQEFTVGDIIAGTPEASGRYGYTTEDMTKAVVTSVMSDDRIMLRVIEHKDSTWIGRETGVDAKFFKLVQTVKQAEEAEAKKIAEELAKFAAPETIEVTTKATAGKVVEVPAGVVSMTGDEHELCVELADGTEIHGSPASVVDFMERMKKSVEAGRL